MMRRQISFQQSQKVESPYFRGRQSLQSPECSTVVEINPSCDSEESMLEKIIFANQKPQKYQTNYNQGGKKILEQFSTNNILSNRNFDKKPAFYETNSQRTIYQKSQSEFKPKYNYFDRQNQQNVRSVKIQSDQRKNYSPNLRLNSDYSTKSLWNHNSTRQNKQNLTLKRQNYHSVQLKKNYAQSKHDYHNVFDESESTSSIIDQEKLRQIQQKIKSYQNRNPQNQQGSNKRTYQPNRKMSLRDNIQNQLKSIEIQPYTSKLTKKQTIIDNIFCQKQLFKKFQCPKQENSNRKDKTENDKSRQKFTTSGINQPHVQQIRGYLEQIFYKVTNHSMKDISAQNIDLKRLSIEEIKLILGPIFSQVRIRNKAFSKNQFIQRSLNIFTEYKKQELKEILYFLKVQASQSTIQSNLKNTQHNLRMPGKLLRNSKTSQNKNKQNTGPKRDNVYLQTHQKPDFYRIQEKKLFQQQEKQTFRKNQQSSSKKDSARVTKTVYMQPTQSDQANLKSWPQKEQKDKFGINLNSTQKTLELMLASQRQKMYILYPSDQIMIQSDHPDDELQRLKNLQARFSQHFGTEKSKI